MNNKQVKKQIRDEFSFLHCNNLKEKLLFDIYSINQIEPEKQTKHFPFFRFNMSLLCIVIAFFLLLIPDDPSYEFLIAIDVNPSIELQISKDNYIKKVVSCNSKAEQIIQNLELEDKHIDEGIYSLINCLFINGYINNIDNSLLLSVQGNNKDSREKVKTTIISDIKKVFQDYNFNASILLQDLESNQTIRQCAKKYNISIGKAAIIQELINNNASYSFDDLKDLSINDLNTLIHYKNLEFKKITKDGVESHEGYLRDSDIKNKVISHSKALEEEIHEYSCTLDCKDNRLIYYVTFKDSYGAYQYLINAISGEIISFSVKIQ